MAQANVLYTVQARANALYKVQNARLDWQQGVKAIERATGVSYAEIQGPSRHAPIVAARWQVIALLRSRGWSLPKIGKELHRDHTTILYALKRIAEAEAQP